MTLDRAKSLRTNMTDAERRLWYRLRAHRFGGVKFKRQVPIGPYIADFVSIAQKLIIEVDGGQHGGLSDRARTRWLEGQGYRVLRFWNNEVLSNTSAVLQVVSRALAQDGQPSPGALGAPPSPEDGRGETSEI